MRATVEALKAETAALRSCLATSGVLPAARLQAEIHRLRFTALLEAHPCSFNANVDSIFHLDDFATKLALYMGWHSTSLVALTSQGVRRLFSVMDPLDGTSTPVPLDGRVCMW